MGPLRTQSEEFQSQIFTPTVVLDAMITTMRSTPTVVPHLSRSHSSSENSPESPSLATPREPSWNIESNPFEITDVKLGMKRNFYLVRIHWVFQKSTTPLFRGLAPTMVLTKCLFLAHHNHSHLLPVVAPH